MILMIQVYLHLIRQKRTVSPVEQQQGARRLLWLSMTRLLGHRVAQRQRLQLAHRLVAHGHRPDPLLRLQLARLLLWLLMTWFGLRLQLARRLLWLLMTREPGQRLQLARRLLWLLMTLRLGRRLQLARRLRWLLMTRLDQRLQLARLPVDHHGAGHLLLLKRSLLPMSTRLQNYLL